MSSAPRESAPERPPEQIEALRREAVRRVKSSRAWQRVGLLFLVSIVTFGLALIYPAVTRGQELLEATWQSWWFLFLTLLIPFVFWRATYGEDRRTPRLRLGTLLPLALGPSGFRVWLRDVPGVFRAVGLGFLVLALARPVNTQRPTTSDERGIDIVL